MNNVGGERESFFFIAQTGRYTYIDCGATQDFFFGHAGTYTVNT
jgi:hypothetical protein